MTPITRRIAAELVTLGMARWRAPDELVVFSARTLAPHIHSDKLLPDEPALLRFLPHTKQ